jgi:glycerophosphoryl diester phosphodiesterase
MDIIAHRGASWDAPENTLAAFQLAWKQGADGIEGDFRLTADNHLVCMHDASTLRITGTDLEIRKTPLKDLLRLDAGHWKGPRWAGQRIPTLEQVLETVPPGKKIYLEIKDDAGALQSLFSTLSRAGVPLRQVRILSFDPEVIARTKVLIPDVKTHWLTTYEAWESESFSRIFTGILRPSLQRTRADGLGGLAHPGLDVRFSRWLKNLGCEFHVWTVNDPAELRRYQQMGVCSLTTDRPGLMRTHLKEAGGYP